ncbi:phospho-sugar mutase [Lutispora saccharofermentans]|uniref:Phosphoglucomutase n=1 Tax=Lutispora saccharofermentans TaxID=3024236 RepID=A0ABT1NH06_9FIRM|nr:phospho-sugar mutase [Lutispora saccharofermentans]MCQ1529413.1 phospho-sugar mutase [Lutispora saccharofermentans]
MDYRKRYEDWINGENFDDDTKKELIEISNDEKEIEDRFYKDLHFGTGGLRGVIGAGTNRMNKYTVARATKGLANYIIKQNEKEPSVVIAHDSRHFSKEFAREAAGVLLSSGIKVYLFEDLRPTPELSFAVRQTKSAAGIVITASHNPPEYNGYKVYWKDGGQIVSPVAEELMEEINNITDFSEIKCLDGCTLESFDDLHHLGEEMDKIYIDKVKSLSLNPEAIREAADLKIVYTPLHGSGNMPVRRVLKEIGFENVHVVPEQEKPDGSFPTVKYPNPEEVESFNLALGMAKKLDADLILATDPDCDRVGVIVKKDNAGYLKLTGNQTGILLGHYIFDSLKEKGLLREESFMIDTIVTGRMTEKIAKSFGIEVLSTLTGFKYIAQQIKEQEDEGGKHFVFGYEESYGYLAGNFVRDKDAVIASMLISEMAAYYKNKGMTLYDALTKLYEKYGYHMEELISLVLKGKEGAEKIGRIMDKMRNKPPKAVAGLAISEVRDYMIYEGPIKLPKDNVLYFVLEDGSWFAMRPSGTEPKLKIYIGVADSSQGAAENKMKLLIDEIKGFLGAAR